jgi:hypothetical protein
MEADHLAAHRELMRESLEEILKRKFKHVNLKASDREQGVIDAWKIRHGKKKVDFSYGTIFLCPSDLIWMWQHKCNEKTAKRELAKKHNEVKANPVHMARRGPYKDGKDMQKVTMCTRSIYKDYIVTILEETMVHSDTVAKHYDMFRGA